MLLEKIRLSYPETYKQRYGYYDFWIASYKLATGKKDEIRNFLNFFIEYPDHSPDELFKLVHMLEAFDCLDILQEFVPRIYVPVCRSPKIIGGADILETMEAILFARHAKPDYTREDAEKLAADFSALDVDIIEKYRSPERMEKFLSQIFASPPPLENRRLPHAEAVGGPLSDSRQEFFGVPSFKKGDGMGRRRFQHAEALQLFGEGRSRRHASEDAICLHKKIRRRNSHGIVERFPFYRKHLLFRYLERDPPLCRLPGRCSIHFPGIPRQNTTVVYGTAHRSLSHTCQKFVRGHRL